MGWNEIEVKYEQLFSNIENKIFYFLHSYYVELVDEKNMICTTGYINRFVSVFIKYNIYGVQFHPEVNDTEFGSNIFENFVNICKSAKSG